MKGESQCRRNRSNHKLNHSPGLSLKLDIRVTSVPFPGELTSHGPDAALSRAMELRGGQCISVCARSNTALGRTPWQPSARSKEESSELHAQHPSDPLHPLVRLPHLSARTHRQDPRQSWRPAPRLISRRPNILRPGLTKSGSGGSCTAVPCITSWTSSLGRIPGSLG